MATAVIMPKMEMSQETSTVIEWLKQEGDEVKRGDVLLTVETDKVTADVESPAAGILSGIRVAPQQEVPVTEIIAYILEPGESLPEEAPPPAPAVAATPVAQRLAAARGVNLSTVAGTGADGRITKADVEAVLAAPSPSTGLRATPAARRLAREHGVDLATVGGSGPRGRIQAADVLAARPATVAPEAVGQVVPLAGMRRTIAERMTASYQTAPHIMLTVRVDVGAFAEARAQLNARAEAAGQTRASVTALLVKAVAWGLKRHPWLNSSLQDDGVHLLSEINVGVAVALEGSASAGGGLIVPVVRRADVKGVAEIAAEVKDLAVRAREGRLTPGDVAGGTFTLSNLGPFGIEQFKAIINPPQAAILAVGSTQPEVVVAEAGEPVVRPVMRMTLSVDHRVVDGATAARFLSDLRDALESPALLLW